MCDVYGISYHSPDIIIMELAKHFNIPIAKVQIIPPSTIMAKGKRYKKVLMFMRVKDYLSNLSFIGQNLDDRHVFIFDSALDLYPMQEEGLVALDYVVPKDILTSNVAKTDLKWELFNKVVSKGVVDKARTTFDDVIDSKLTEQHTILKPVMTQIYKLKSSTQQKPVRTCLWNWFYYGGTEADLDYFLDAMQKTVKLPSKVSESIRNLLLSDTGILYRDAINYLRTHPKEDLDKYVLIHNISSYEIRYIQTSISKGYEDNCDCIPFVEKFKQRK